MFEPHKLRMNGFRPSMLEFYLGTEYDATSPMGNARRAAMPAHPHRPLCRQRRLDARPLASSRAAFCARAGQSVPSRAKSLI